MHTVVETIIATVILLMCGLIARLVWTVAVLGWSIPDAVFALLAQ